MSNNKSKCIPVNWTSAVSPNVIDWIRSIYFSLFGSSMLTLSLKISTLSADSRVLFIAGVLAFLLGLFVSVGIANRFKRYEKNYDNQSEGERIAKEPKVYFYEQETDKKFFKKILMWTEHVLLWVIWIPALICVGYAGFYIEDKSAKSSAETNAVISNINSKVQQIHEKSQNPSRDRKSTRLNSSHRP